MVSREEFDYSIKEIWKHMLSLVERLEKLEAVQRPEKYNPIPNPIGNADDLEIRNTSNQQVIKTYHSPLQVRRMLETASRNRYESRERSE